MLQLTDIQRSDEKALFGFAMVFSIACWAAVLISVIGAIAAPIKPSRICVWEYDDYPGEYYYELYTTSIADGTEDWCLPEGIALLGDEDRAAAQEMALTEAQTLKYGAIGGLFVVFTYVGGFFFVFYCITALAMAHIRLNGVRLSPQQYPDLYKLYKESADALGVTKLPNAYVIDSGGEANAFAIKIARRKMVVFYSELVERLVDEKKTDELKAIAAHELTHVKLKHIAYWILLIPFNMLPFVDSLLSRLREFSADRGALFVVQKEEVVTQALLKLVAGKKLGKQTNVEQYMEQIETEKGLFVLLAKLTSTHPPMPTRIKELKMVAKYAQ